MSDLPETFSLQLDPPIKVKGGEVSVIELKEPRARQVRDAEARLDERLSEASATEYQMTLVRLVSDVPQEVVNELPIVALGQAMGFLQAFIDAGTDDEEATVRAEEDAGGIDLDSLPATVEVPIDPPVKWQGVEYGMIMLRQPRASELKQARQHMRSAVTPLTVRTYQLALLTSVSGLPPAVVDGLRIRTATEATRHLARFIRAGRQAGKASSAS